MQFPLYKQGRMQICPFNLDFVLLFLHNSKVAYYKSLLIRQQSSWDSDDIQTSFPESSSVHPGDEAKDIRRNLVFFFFTAKYLTNKIRCKVLSFPWKKNRIYTAVLTFDTISENKKNRHIM